MVVESISKTFTYTKEIVQSRKLKRRSLLVSWPQSSITTLMHCHDVIFLLWKLSKWNSSQPMVSLDFCLLHSLVWLIRFSLQMNSEALNLHHRCCHEEHSKQIKKTHSKHTTAVYLFYCHLLPKWNDSEPIQLYINGRHPFCSSSKAWCIISSTPFDSCGALKGWDAYKSLPFPQI